jgi:hypothetical protein
MDTNDIRGSLINTYLNQQLAVAHEQDSGIGSNGTGGAVQHIELPDAAILDEFKNHVRAWIEIDNVIRKLQAAVKERNALKKQLTEKILRFMSKYNIEDLNTRDGSKLRYKAGKSTAAPSKAQIKERLMQYYGNVASIDELTEKVFEKAQKDTVSLRRLNPPKQR